MIRIKQIALIGNLLQFLSSFFVRRRNQPDSVDQPAVESHTAWLQWGYDWRPLVVYNHSDVDITLVARSSYRLWARHSLTNPVRGEFSSAHTPVCALCRPGPSRDLGIDLSPGL